MNKAQKEYWHKLKDTPVGLNMLLDEFVGLGVKAVGAALVATAFFYIAFLYDQPLVLIPGVVVAGVFVWIFVRTHEFSEMIEANPHYRASVDKKN
jgi:hypothetical protein